MSNGVNSSLVMLAAGGTGGHLFPAQALAEELVRRGHRIHLMTDERVRDYGKAFPAEATHIVPSASLSLSAPLRVPGQALRLVRGYLTARGLVRQHGPRAVVGFGGYPSLPPLFAAARAGVATLVHEQNSVLGRANKLLATRVGHVATSFETVFNVPDNVRSKLVLTGNPVRSAVLGVAGAAYPTLGGQGSIQLLVFGGSQGARFFSDAVPGAIALLPEDLRKRLFVTQQARGEDTARVAKAYAELGVASDVQAFFSNMPALLARTHLVVCRSGASTIAELGVVGRPAIMVPLPNAIDNDQLRNAESFARAGGGWLHPQASIETGHLSSVIKELLNAPDRLKEAAQAALRHGRPDAAARLADLVETDMSGMSRTA